MLVAVDCASASRVGAEPGIVDCGAVRDQRRSPPRQPALRERQPRRPRRVLDRRGARRPLRGARSRAHAADRRGAVHRARHGYRPVPVREHDAEGTAARGRPRRGGGRRPPRLPGRLRERPVREAQAARPRARARAGARGGRDRRVAPRARRLRGGRRDRAVLGGDHRRAPLRRGLARIGAHPGAAARRRPAAQGVAALLGRRGRRERDRAQVGRRRTSRGRRLLERAVGRGDHRLHRARGLGTGRVGSEPGACPESESGRHTGVRRRDAASSVASICRHIDAPASLPRTACRVSPPRPSPDRP